MPFLREAFVNYRVVLDTLDILVVAVVIYTILTLIRGTRAVRMVVGIVALLGASLISRWLNLAVLDWALTSFFQVFLVAVIVIFQPELRRVLAQMGRNPFSLSAERHEDRRVVQEIGKAAGMLSSRLIGALIVVGRETDLGNFIEGGVTIGGEVSRELLVSIFLPYSPIHDGAVIIRHGKVVRAGCFLPLSSSSRISKEMGTRHRAALGLSEETDALVVVVSEETGNISVATDGQLTRVTDVAALTDFLGTHLLRPRGAPRETVSDGGTPDEKRRDDRG
jgi:diadenylate cyclase